MIKKDKFSEEPILETEDKSNKKARSKKAILVCFFIMLIIGFISTFFLFIKPDLLTNLEEDVEKEILGMYGSQHSIIHYPIDHELDVSEVDEYLELDRYVHYTDGMETVAIDENNIDIYGKDVEFFVMYFHYVIEGDWESYNAQFTDNYYKENEPYYSFTQQMVYDIYVDRLSSETDGSKTIYTYDVSYKILRNNGTFRNDIGSDASKTLFFTLIEENGKILIDSIQYYKN